ncbi:MAG TPA: hypothetical protein VE980_04545 [Pyrinomonadaceae bacterium]|nr:hypothetical protein [Pyrinomonadaceae bacterium]
MNIECNPEVTARHPISFSSDGSRLLVAEKDNTVRIYPTSRQAFIEISRRLLGK